MSSTHVVLLQLTQAGRDGLRSNLEAVGEHLTNALRSAEGALVTFQWTAGVYDAVAVVELDDELVPGFSMWLGGALGATTTTLRAYDGAELRAVLDRWDETQPDTGGLGP